jgi:hypothetical protein
MDTKESALCACTGIILALFGCSRQPARVVEIRHFPLDSVQGVITKSVVQIDRDITSDGNGSLRINASGPITIRLFDLGDPGIENARLTYRAKLRTENVQGRVYLEMLCDFTETGEIISRGLQNSLTGTHSWLTREVSVSLEKGEHPDDVKINLIIDGKGVVWIDDIQVFKEPLR